MHLKMSVTILLINFGFFLHMQTLINLFLIILTSLNLTINSLIVNLKEYFYYLIAGFYFIIIFGKY
jgi:hypothetical protein